SGHRGVEAHVSAAGASIMPSLTPRQIVQELDKHIVGQAAAKGAVAIGLRNRWRRMQVGEPLRQEITPKNILMIGPTGVGKTEIARRLAKLANAPFVKVEATKFTEVGYVGRDVDSIVKELADVAVKITREQEMVKVRERAQEAAEERVLDTLLPKPRAMGFSTDEPAQPRNGETREKLRRMLEAHELDDREIEIVRLEHPAQLLAGLAVARLRRLIGGKAHHAWLGQERVQHPLLGGLLGALAHLDHLLLARDLDRDVGELRSEEHPSELTSPAH